METLDTTSYWLGTVSTARYPKLDRKIKVDVIVVGGGITGITAAYLIKKAGYTVALLERERLARIDTGHTTAHLTSVTDVRLYELIDKFGEAQARAVWDAGSAAIDQIFQLVTKEKIDCGFRWLPGYLHAPLGGEKPEDRKELEREAEAARKLEIGVEFLPDVPTVHRAGLRFGHQAIFNPAQYLAALAAKIPGHGSYIFENTSVDEVEEKPLRVTCGENEVRGNHLVLATHTPLTGVSSTLGAMMFQSKLFYYTSYALGARLPHDVAPQASFWDTSDPYYYLRVERRHGYDYAIFGGEDHKTGQEPDTAKRYARLEKVLHSILPEAKVDYRWSGQVLATPDGLPYIGETDKKQFAGTGFSGNGMTFGTLTAMMAVDWLEKRKNPWQELFAPSRKKFFGGAWEYLKENKDYPYYMARDWIGGAQGSSLSELARNQGKVLNLDGKKVAAYRDADGKVTCCSAVCTHLQCIVGWNPAEQTWDCPCHGSRFKTNGEVISGPAEAALEKNSRAKVISIDSLAF